MVEPVMQHHSSSGKFPCEGAIDTIRDLVEAAISNEETISTAAREMREIEHQLGERVRTLPNWVAAEVNRRLEETVDKTATRISAGLTNATSAAERVHAHYANAVKFSIYKLVWDRSCLLRDRMYWHGLRRIYYLHTSDLVRSRRAPAHFIHVQYGAG
jgi:hypothetical protein